MQTKLQTKLQTVLVALGALVLCKGQDDDCTINNQIRLGSCDKGDSYAICAFAVLRDG